MTIEEQAENDLQFEPTKGKLARWRDNFAVRAAKAEAGFLSLLRYAALGIAAVVLLGAAVFFGTGLFKQLGPTRVDAQGVTMAAEDLAPPKAAANAAPERANAPAPAKPTVSEAIRKRTLAVYQSRFKGFQRADNKTTDQQIVDIVWTPDRIKGFGELGSQLQDKDGNVLADRDAVMRDALGLVEAAAQSDNFKKALTAYRDAKKVNVCTDETRTRTRTVDGWDSSATFCSNWYESPIGCAATRVVEEPYVVKLCEMKFPENLDAPGQQFAAAVQRYLDRADTRLSEAYTDASAQTGRNQQRKEEGIAAIGQSGQLFLAFMAVMFLYLFVAMERHHRSLRALIAKGEE